MTSNFDFNVWKPRQLVKCMKLVSPTGWLIVFTLTAFMFKSTSSKSYSPDSWGYVDIARSLFSREREIGDILGTRDYSNVPWQNDSFPFLWPLVISPFLKIFQDPAVPVGAYLFVLVWLLNILVVKKILIIIDLPSGFAPYVGLVLLATPGYLDEGISGRSIPLNLLLICTSFLVFFKTLGQSSLKGMIGVGLLLGLSASNRFDSILFGPVIILCATAGGLIPRRKALAGLATWGISPVSWSLYSWNKFQTLYISDNSEVAIANNSRMVTDWNNSSNKLGFDVSDYLMKVADNVLLIIKVFLISYQVWIIPFLISLLFSFAILRFNMTKTMPKAVKADSTLGNDKNSQIMKFLVLVLFSTGSIQSFAMITTGYPDVRYWISVGGVVLLIVFFYYKKLQLNFSSQSKRKDFLRLVIIANVCTLSWLGILSTLEKYENPLNSSSGDQRIVRCIVNAKIVPIIPGIEGFRIPAISNLRVATPPGNSHLLRRKDWQELRDKFGITGWINLSGKKQDQIPSEARDILSNVDCRDYF